MLDCISPLLGRGLPCFPTHHHPFSFPCSLMWFLAPLCLFARAGDFIALMPCDFPLVLILVLVPHRTDAGFPQVSSNMDGLHQACRRILKISQVRVRSIGPSLTWVAGVTEFTLPLVTSVLARSDLFPISLVSSMSLCLFGVLLWLRALLHLRTAPGPELTFLLLLGAASSS